MRSRLLPPLLSLGGKLHLGTKADLLDCLGVEEIQSTGSPAVRCQIAWWCGCSSHAQSWHSKNFSRIFGPRVSSLCLKSANNSHESGYSVWCIYSRYRRKALPGKKEERESEGKWLQVLKSWKTRKIFFTWTRIQVFITELFICLSIDHRQANAYATDRIGVSICNG